MRDWEGPDWRVDDNYNGLELGEPEPGEEVPDYTVDEEWASGWVDYTSNRDLMDNEWRVDNVG